MNVVDLIADLADLFGVKLTENQFAWYAMALSDLPVEQVCAAMQSAMRTCKFMPKPAELLELAGAGQKLAAADMPVLAWEAVKRAMRVIGYDQTADFDDPIVNATIRDLGGWPTVCDTTTDEMKWLERRFTATYTAFAKCRLPAESTARLPGYTQTANSRNGYADHPVPVSTVPSLTSAGSGSIERRLEVRATPTRRIEGAIRPAKTLAEALARATEPEQPKPVVAVECVILDAAEQVQLLRARFGRGKPVSVEFDGEKLDGDVKLAMRSESQAESVDRELQRITSAPLHDDV